MWFALFLQIVKILNLYTPVNEFEERVSSSFIKHIEVRVSPCVCVCVCAMFTILSSVLESLNKLFPVAHQSFPLLLSSFVLLHSLLPLLLMSSSHPPLFSLPPPLHCLPRPPPLPMSSSRNLFYPCPPLHI